MPNNYPFEQWYWNDWFASTIMLDITVKGIWHELIGRMFLNDRGYEIVGTCAELARAVGCAESEIIFALNEMKRRKVAEITIENEKIADLCVGSSAIVAIVCRRRKKEFAERERKRTVAKEIRRSKKIADVSKDCSDDVALTRALIPITNNHIQVSSLRSDTCEGEKRAQACDRYPQSVEDVIAIAKQPTCGVVMTRTQAEAYFTNRMASDWIDASNRRIIPSRVCYDIRKWVMRDSQDEKNNPNRKTRATFPGDEDTGKEERDGF